MLALGIPMSLPVIDLHLEEKIRRGRERKRREEAKGK
jgi:hypothetical protein